MRIGYLWLFLWIFPLCASYKTSYGYGQDLYNLLMTYIVVNKPDNASDYVKKLLSSGDVQDIYKAADADGFTHIEVIKATYFVALHDDIIQPSIVKGIQAYFRERKKWRMIYFYSWNAFVFANLFMTVYCIRFFKRYFRYNLLDLTTYY